MLAESSVFLLYAMELTDRTVSAAQQVHFL